MADQIPSSSWHNTSDSVTPVNGVGEEVNNDYSRVSAEGVEYLIEPSNIDGSHTQYEPVTDNETLIADEASNAPSMSTVQYHEIHGIRIPSSFGRSILQSPTNSAMVEESVHVLSTPPLPPPRPPCDKIVVWIRRRYFWCEVTTLINSQ